MTYEDFVCIWCSTSCCLTSGDSKADPLSHPVIDHQMILLLNVANDAKALTACHSQTEHSIGCVDNGKQVLRKELEVCATLELE